MKITETITPINSEKTIAGHRDLELTLNTETGRLTINAPAMFVDPVVPFTEMQQALDKLAVHMERETNA